jgi:hypothetical protein
MAGLNLSDANDHTVRFPRRFNDERDELRGGAGSTGSTRERPSQGSIGAPALHWVGDGFRVAGYFSSIPDAGEKAAARSCCSTIIQPTTTRPRHTLAASACTHTAVSRTVTIAWQAAWPITTAPAAEA